MEENTVKITASPNEITTTTVSPVSQAAPSDEARQLTKRNSDGPIISPRTISNPNAFTFPPVNASTSETQPATTAPATSAPVSSTASSVPSQTTANAPVSFTGYQNRQPSTAPTTTPSARPIPTATVVSQQQYAQPQPFSIYGQQPTPQMIPVLGQPRVTPMYLATQSPMQTQQMNQAFAYQQSIQPQMGQQAYAYQQSQPQMTPMMQMYQVPPQQPSQTQRPVSSASMQYASGAPVPIVMSSSYPVSNYSSASAISMSNSSLNNMAEDSRRISSQSDFTPPAGFIPNQHRGSVSSASSGDESTLGVVTPLSKLPGQNEHLKVGQNARLMDLETTIELYRQNARKTDDMDIQFEFSKYLIEAANSLAPSDPGYSRREALLDEGYKFLKKLSTLGHSESQFFLATTYAADGMFDKAFPLYVLAGKHNHSRACFEAAVGYELGRGTKRDSSRAVQYYRKAATTGTKEAMYRLGMALLNGELGLKKDVKDGVKWLKRAAAVKYDLAIFELAKVYEVGILPNIHKDGAYAGSLYVEAANLGCPDAMFKVGTLYEYGKLDFPVSPADSIQWFRMGAEAKHPECMFALAGWYLTGSEGVLPQSDEQAYYWVKLAADAELTRAEFAMGYFAEEGIGMERDMEVAKWWYTKAAQHGDKRALQRLEGQQPDAMGEAEGVKSSDKCLMM